MTRAEALEMLEALVEAARTERGRRLLAALHTLAVDGDADDAPVTEAERLFAEARRKDRERAVGLRPVTRRGQRRRADGGTP